MRLNDGQCGLLEHSVKRELARLADIMRTSLEADNLSAVYASACDILALIDDCREPTDARIRQERVADSEAN
jgi:hypothetical protein